MSSPFSTRTRADGTVEVLRGGRVVTVVRGARAAQLLAEVEDGDEQGVLQRWTGNYRRGNERVAREHPRSRGR